jgi:hypothetical protein
MVTTENKNTERLNADVMNFVNGKEGIDSAQQSGLYDLMAYNRVTNEAEWDTMTDFDLPVFRRIPLSSTDRRSLQEGGDENSVGEVRDALEAYYRDRISVDKTPIDVEDLLKMTEAACLAVYKQQLHQLNYSMGSNLDAQLEQAVKVFEDKVPARDDRGDYITSISPFLKKMRDVYDKEVEFSGPAHAVFDDTNRHMLFVMLKPWFVMRFLASFIPGGDWNASGNSFNPNYQESQYAKLAMFRVVFDSLDHIQQYLVRTDSSLEDMTYLSDLSYRITDTINKEFVTRRKEKFPEWKNQVSDKSQKTKDASMRLFQINAQLERRKQNLLVMMHNHGELQREARRQSWIFWATVAAYIVVVAILIGLIVTSQFTILYGFSGALVLIPTLWYVVNLVRKTYDW